MERRRRPLRHRHRSPCSRRSRPGSRGRDPARDRGEFIADGRPHRRPDSRDPAAHGLQRTTMGACDTHSCRDVYGQRRRGAGRTARRRPSYRRSARPRALAFDCRPHRSRGRGRTRKAHLGRARQRGLRHRWKRTQRRQPPPQLLGPRAASRRPGSHRHRGHHCRRLPLRLHPHLLCRWR